MGYVNRAPQFSEERNQLKMTEQLNDKQKSPHFRGLIDEILIFSSVAGEGFEPPTFGL